MQVYDVVSCLPPDAASTPREISRCGEFPQINSKVCPEYPGDYDDYREQGQQNDHFDADLSH